MFKEHSDAYIKIGNKDHLIVCNQSDEQMFIEKLSFGESFYIKDSGFGEAGIVFSIENAIKLRDYLNDMIEVAEKSGYFDPKEMTLKEIEDKLGYKVKIIG